MSVRPLAFRAFGVAALLVPTAAADVATLPENVFAPPPSAVLRLPDDVFARSPDDDRVDVVLIGAKRAAVVRLGVKFGDRGYRSAWGDFVVRLHAYLDRNGDGTLTTAEANQAPWTNLLQNPFNGGRGGGFRNAKPTPVDADRDGKVTVDELSAYLRGMQDYDAVAVRAGQPPDARTEAVFKHVDRDDDKAISAAELGTTESLLARLDRDEDEIIELNELTPDRSPFADQFRQVNVMGASVDVDKKPVVVLANDDVRGQVARRLVNAYRDPASGGPPYALNPAALGLSGAAVRAADANGDGRLQASEIAAYLSAPAPDLELSVALNGSPGGNAPARFTASPQGPGAVEGLAVKDGANGSVAVTFDGAEIEFRVNDAMNQFPPDFFENQFTTADADKNGVLDAKEVRGNFYFQRMFPVADRDGNGKMTRAEMKAYNRHNQDAFSNRLILSLADRGSTLHQRLDANGDQRLSLRELRKAGERLRPLDRNGDGRIVSEELPRGTLLAVGRGNENTAVTVTIQESVVEPRRSSTGPRPAWFVGMDRNRDGDVSPREFLGTPAHFRLFDADGDGLIDADEASKAP